MTQPWGVSLGGPALGQGSIGDARMMGDRVGLLRRLVVAVWLVMVAPAWAVDPVQTLAYEVIPAAQVDLPGLDSAGYAERAAVTTRVLTDLLPAVFRAIGVDPDTVATAVVPGGYQLQTNPALVSRVAAADTRADRIAAALGYVFRQSGVLVFNLSDPAGGTDYVIVRFPPGALNNTLAHRFFRHAADSAKGLGGGYSVLGDDMVFLNLRDGGTPYSGLDAGAFAVALRRAVAGFRELPVTVAAVGTAEAHLMSNDWDRASEGETYLCQLGGTESALAMVLSGLRDRHADLVTAAGRR